MKPKKTLPENRSDCARYEQDLLLYLHNAISPRTKGQLMAHLRRCRACRGKLKAFSQATTMLAASVRGTDLPLWTPPRTPASIWRREIPWYTPLVVFFFAVGAAVLFFEYGGGDWIGSRSTFTPVHAFREKMLTHSRSAIPGKIGICRKDSP